MLCTKLDGIYFGMPEDEYHALPRLSSSGIQNMLISPATFWAGSWMNPDREQEDDTSWQIIGRAYHTARFEPDELHKRFVRDLVKEDLPEGSLLNDTDLKAALKDLGEPQTKGGESVGERAARLAILHDAIEWTEEEPRPKIWHVELAEFEEAKGQRQGIPPKVWAEIERDIERIHRNPEIAALVTGGAAEVTVLWTCPERGNQMKARLDYLRPDGFTDFKTFENSRGKHLEQAVLDAFRYNRYYIQATVYWQAAELIRRGAVEIQGEATEAQAELVKKIRERPVPMAVWYVFQEKRGIPNLLAREFMIFNLDPSLRFAAPDEAAEIAARNKYGSETLIYRKAAAEIEYAKRTFNTMMEIYGGDGEPWYPINALGRIEDESFSLNWLESDW